MASNREREELHKAIWSIADDLRGSVDGWDFKQYILGIMFYRYISENIANYINEGERKAGDATFDYAKLKDSEAECERANLVKEKGFFILPSELFCNVVKSAKSDSATFVDVEGKTKSVKDNLNEYLEMIFNNIENSAKGAESEDDFAGLFDDIDVNSNKLGSTVTKRNEKLVKILDGIAGIKLGNYQDNNIDAFGDAYEFLMSMYASNAGKSGGEFYTPQEVSELLTRLAIVGKTSVNKVYDPACGSGSLLLKSAKILGKDNVRNGFFGQEINLTTYNLCRINMFLHDIDYDKFDIACEDTLVSPQHWDDEPFEVIVSNPPYSIKWAGDDNAVLINDPRYSPAGVLAPKSKADFAFIMHSLSWLATNGTASIVCFPGIFTRPGAEQKIRKYLIDNNFIDCIIKLPANLFFGTSIVTCIMVLKKSKKTNDVLFINASNEFSKITNNNKLEESNIENIMNYYLDRKDIEYISKVATREEIEKENYNLDVTTYVEEEDTREKINIKELNEKICLNSQILSKSKDDYEKALISINKKLDKIKEKMNSEEVEHVSLDKVCEINTGSQLNKTKLLSEGQYAVINGGINPSGYWNEYNTDANTITISQGGASAGYVNYMESPFWAGAHCYVVKLINKEVDYKFLYYFIKSKEFELQKCQQGAGIPGLSRKSVYSLSFPLIKKEEQKEIVELLDNYTELSQKICECLNNELVMREKEYNFYRENLLSFEESKIDE